ncbi:MAG: tRNA uridine-5-carboxymethylaminomethyl(34) synthesis GTPase MnmE [candidate division Zixibacteria bacterium]|nr:tRNA uridine-5-carboxymethylaminomethyl(34) synthesis GTPase MnmE [candidate division Zixibacteria bacterium]
MYNPHDTICAISTPPGESALAVVRLTGADSKSTIEKHIKGNSLKDRQAALCDIIDLDNKVIDEVVVIWYKEPRSYTAEDLVEIICHGGHVISEQILTLLCISGARLAEPGEFTVRAFLNGRLDLTEAEAVNSVIKARSSKSKQYALHNLEGKLKHRLDKISARLIELITVLEAEIDFDDDEVTKLDLAAKQGKIDEISALLSRLISTYDIGRIAEGRAQVAIVGAPNVGKSSIFNRILQTNRAIVTDVPGTTRDYLSEYVNIGGYPVILTDTAGIRKSDQEIEQIGVERSRELVDSSDLCLYVIDASRKIDDRDVVIAEILYNKPFITLINKIDLIDDPSANIGMPLNFDQIVQTSATTGKGIDNLLTTIQRELLKDVNETGDGVLLSQRQLNCSVKAAEQINQAGKANSGAESEEIVVGILREALEQIGQITGKVTSDDILNKIFSEFCIGK